jgi:NADH:ubiquinone oxidoreductase subunit H
MRYDTLMQLLWKSYLPLSLGFVIWVASIIFVYG